MALFLQYWTIIHEIYCNLDLRYLLNWNKNNLYQNTKYWSKRISFKEMNSSPSAPHSIEVKYVEKTWDGRKNKMKLICPWSILDCTCKLWFHWISLKYLSGLSKNQLGWESLPLKLAKAWTSHPLALSLSSQ